MPHRYRIVLADDHQMFRRGVKRIIQENAELEVVGEANDGLQLLEIVKQSPPDMVIVDVSMPNLRGLEATREIKMTCPEMKSESADARNRASPTRSSGSSRRGMDCPDVAFLNDLSGPDISRLASVAVSPGPMALTLMLKGPRAWARA